MDPAAAPPEGHTRRWLLPGAILIAAVVGVWLVSNTGPFNLMCVGTSVAYLLMRWGVGRHPEWVRKLIDVVLLYLLGSCLHTRRKLVLQIFNYPLLCAAGEVSISAASVVLLGLVGIMAPLPLRTAEQARVLLPATFWQMVAHGAYIAALKFGHVSFVELTKAVEPLLVLALARLILHDHPTAQQMLCLIPIVGGIFIVVWHHMDVEEGILASLVISLLSTVGSGCRTISGKLVQHELTPSEAFLCINTLHALVILPVALAVDVPLLLQRSEEMEPTEEVGVIILNVIANAFLHYAYNEMIYRNVGNFTAFTSSIVQGVGKRLFFIVVGVAVFRNHIGLQGWTGTMVTLVGCGMYSYATTQAHAMKGKH